MARDRSGGCDTGRKCYPTKRKAETATGEPAERCKRCRQWHSKYDRPQSRRGGG